MEADSDWKDQNARKIPPNGNNFLKNSNTSRQTIPLMEVLIILQINLTSIK
jgi:hypothetical protein